MEVFGVSRMDFQIKNIKYFTLLNNDKYFKKSLHLAFLLLDSLNFVLFTTFKLETPICIQGEEKRKKNSKVVP